MKKEETMDNWNLPTQNYGSYLKANREHFGLTKEQLVDGLCAKSMVSDLEAGKKGAGWLIEERLLRRGRVADDACEKYLDDEDYAEWEERERILDYLEDDDVGQMGEALEKYADKHGLGKVGIGSDSEVFCKNAYSTDGNVTKRLQRQFYLGMSGMCKKIVGVAPEELTEIFDAAVRQSVPKIDTKPLQSLVLCAEEINLILEYAQSLSESDAQSWCRKLKEYLEDERMDDDTKGLNYPKIILVLCRLLRKQDKEKIQACPEILKLCDSAIHLLRKTKKAYYLLEVLEMKKNTLEHMQEFHVSKGQAQKAEALKGILAETEYWLDNIGTLYDRFGMKRGHNSDVYLYRGQDIFHVAEMIRARRKMLGMTQKQLQEGLVCTLDTVQNLERKKHSTQPFHLQEMCKKLGLPYVNSRTELMVANRKARNLEKEIRYAMNDGKFEENLEQLRKLKELIDMSEPINQQWMLRTEGMAKHELGQMSDEEYEGVIKRALECTLPMSVLKYPDEKECYLTNSEMECIYHYSLLVRHEDAKETYRRMKVVFRLEKEFEKAGKEKSHVRTYELYMKYRASLLCEMGECELAKQQVEKVILICLGAGRINILDGLLYVWTRSNIKLQKKETEAQKASYDWKRDLECCLALSQFCCNNVRKEFYKKIWKQIVGDKN